MTDQLDAKSKAKAAFDAGVAYGMNALEQVPKGDPLTLEANITGVLVVFWGALWGTFGTEYARGFIEAQLRGMASDAEHERFTKPPVQ